MTAGTKTPFPNLDIRFSDEAGNITKRWHRLLVDLWKKTGSSQSSTILSAYIQQSNSSSGLPLRVYSATGVFLGEIRASAVAGQPAQPQTLAASPFTYTASQDGILVAENGKIELSRNGGAVFYQVGLVGGGLPMLAADIVKITWFGAVSPKVTFFPT